MTDGQLTPDRLAALQAAFETALERPAEERAGFLATITDPWLANRLAGLLAAHERTGSRLESPVPELAERGLLAAEQVPGDRIGGYRIVRRIGEGGMGTVYEAIRDDDQYRSRVAIKFLRHHATSDVAIARFRRERQILALLTHPNIAVLHDGGVTPDGRPYFVMELVDGLPITTWADQRKLGVTDRLRLFLQGAKAVEYAHQSLVIHRDLKPGNILVNGEGTVKLLDFGIAKLLGDADDPGRPPDTEIGPRAYTPDYASPEQVRGLPAGTRTDVYALGVVLYELLAGVRPLDVRGKSSAEIERVITEIAPPKPSAVLPVGRESDLSERSTARARAALEGDLDAIILMALRKEQDRRYDSVAELARDLRRHLDGLPVSARPDGVGYRFRKLIRRRRVESAAIVLAVAAMITGTVVATVRGREAERERARATEVKAFLATMLGEGKIGIVWSAKSACTTVLLWYLWHRDLLHAARAHHNWPHRFRNERLYSDEAYRTWAGQADGNGWTWLRVIRDPYRRAVSSYRHALRHGYEDGNMSRRLKRSRDAGYSFEEFLDHLLGIDITICNLHHRQQFHPVERLVTPSRVVNADKVDLVQSLVEIGAGLATPREPLEALHAAVATIGGWHNTRPSSVDRDVSAVALTQTDAAGEWPSYQCFLTKSTRAKVAKIYALDLSRYAAFL